MPVELTIDSIGAGGDGVAQTASGVVYVPFTLSGERVLADIARDRGALVDVIEAAPFRVQPICQHFGVCGGCALQHMQVDDYAAWKRDRVVDALAMRGLTPPVDATWRAAPHSRRRAVMTARRSAQGFSLGYHRRLSDDIVDVQSCPILLPQIESALPRLRRAISHLVHAGHDARITVLACDNGLDIHAEPGKTPTAADLAKAGRDCADIPGIVRLTVLKDEVYRRAAPELRIAGVLVIPPPGAFVQAIGAAETGLARLVVQGVGKAKNVADLFCGLGTFTLPLARTAKVTAVENDDSLLNALNAARRGASGLKPVTTLRRNLDKEPLSALELNQFEAVVFDPPYSGAFAQTKEIARSKLRKVVAVSCNPASFARDARVLADAGFSITKVAPVDQFLFSPHVELVAWFQR